MVNFIISLNLYPPLPFSSTFLHNLSVRDKNSLKSLEIVKWNTSPDVLCSNFESYVHLHRNVLKYLSLQPLKTSLSISICFCLIPGLSNSYFSTMWASCSVRFEKRLGVFSSTNNIPVSLTWGTIPCFLLILCALCARSASPTCSFYCEWTIVIAKIIICSIADNNNGYLYRRGY